MPRSPRYPARSLGFSAKQPAPGSLTVLRHLARDGGLTEVPAVATIWRILSRRGFITPQPHKRPRSAWKRFCAQQPNELWQADVTHWHLADATEVEISTCSTTTPGFSRRGEIVNTCQPHTIVGRDTMLA
jgi:hypothetical protein